MSVASLSQVIMPPRHPLEPVGSWEEVERVLGTELPADFKEFIRIYGSGTIGNFITVLNPFSKRPGLNLLEQSKRQIAVLEQLRNEFDEENPYELYPAPGGLLPVAITDNGDVVHWHTLGIPDEWTIVVNESRAPEYEEFICGLTAFLEGVVDGSIQCSAFPAPIGGGIVGFRPV